MAKRIIWTKEALADRIQILDYWYQRLGDKDYSFKLDNTFKSTVQLISAFRNIGRKLDNREERCFVKDAYQIFYLEDEKTITILHIWDTRRNPEDFPL
jgi:plasmid stabilization system protein ParE